MASFRLVTLIFSILVHGAVAGVLFAFSGTELGGEEQVYHVSLAEFAEPAAPALPEPAQAAPPPEPEFAPPPEPEPKPEPLKEPETKTISTKKNQETPQKEKAKPRKPEPEQRQTAQPEGNAGPQPSQVGGLAAFRSSQVDQRPSIARRVAPDYPNKAKRMNIEGKVLVQMVVDTSGVPKACIVKSADPPGYFEDAALTAAGKMRFIPGKIKGQAVNTVVLLPFAFQLR